MSEQLSGSQGGVLGWSMMDRWIPESVLAGDNESIRKGRMIIGFLVVMLGMGIFTLLFGLTDVKGLLWTAILLGPALILGSLVVLLLYHRTASNSLAGGVIAILMWVAVALADINTGGMNPRSLYFLVFPLIMAMFLVGWRLSLITFGCTALYIAIVTVLQRMGVSFPPNAALDNPYFFIVDAGFAISFFAMALSLLWQFESVRLESMASVQRAAEAQQKLALDRDAAEEASKAKSEFLANMSHELRTPLNAILGYAELIQEEMGETSLGMYNDDIEKICLSSKHLLSLINDVLDLSKIEAGKMKVSPEWFLIQPLFQELEAELSSVFLKNRNGFSTSIGEGVEKIMSDPVKVRQILINLLSNAAKFTQDGSICLSVERGSYRQEEALIFAVKDNGIGISQEQSLTLFDKFTQGDSSTTKKFGGTGLGLAISKELCELIQGTIAVESELGEGSTFRVTLPLVLHVSPSGTELKAVEA